MPERDETGKFQKGNTTGKGGVRPGAGRKPDEVKKTLQQLMDLAVSDMDWMLIFSKQRDLALQGDLKAAQFLSDRKFGKPKETIEMSGGEDNTRPIVINITPPEKAS